MSVKVFFNESCSICKKEIDLYKNMENKLANTLTTLNHKMSFTRKEKAIKPNAK